MEKNNINTSNLWFYMWRYIVNRIVRRGMCVLVFASAMLVGDNTFLNLLYAILSVLRLIIPTKFSFIFTKLLLLISSISLVIRYIFQFSSCIQPPEWLNMYSLDDIKHAGKNCLKLFLLLSFNHLKLLLFLFNHLKLLLYYLIT